jgi:hypothetical protein
MAQEIDERSFAVVSSLATPMHMGQHITSLKTNLLDDGIDRYHRIQKRAFGRRWAFISVTALHGCRIVPILDDSYQGVDRY